MTVQNLLLFILFSTSLVFCKRSHDQSNCDTQLVETIPENVTFNDNVTFSSTSDQLISIISSAQSSIDIASFYWTLLCSDVDHAPLQSCSVGETVIYAILKKVDKIQVRIVVNDNGHDLASNLKLLEEAGAKVRQLNFNRLLNAGVLHTKFILVDNKSFYIGSSNMDWRSYTQVKELGIVAKQCESLGNDLAKIFNVYWYLAKPDSMIPSKWPKKWESKYNITNPLKMKLNNKPADVYLTSSPKQFNPPGRTNDIDGLLEVIKSAKKFISIAVMDYSTSFLYSKPRKFWPVIDNALKEAVIERNVSVRLLASNWTYTKCSSVKFLNSLDALQSLVGSIGIRVKLFKVPTFEWQKNIPFARVNHNKYMVTDNSVFIGTSNWSADYFINTGGISFVAKFNSTAPGFSNKKSNETLRDQLEYIFNRDWRSNYSFYINHQACMFRKSKSNKWT